MNQAQEYLSYSGHEAHLARFGLKPTVSSHAYAQEVEHCTRATKRLACPLLRGFAGTGKRQRKSMPIGPCTGKDKLTKPEAVRKGAEVIASLGVNTTDHLQRVMNTSPIVTFRQRVEWCRKYHKAWTDGKPGPIQTMESQLTKHILPRFGALPLDAVDETAVQVQSGNQRQLFDKSGAP